MPALNKNLLMQHVRLKYEAAARAAPPTPFASRPGPTIGAHRAPFQKTTDLSTAIAPLCDAICSAHDLWRNGAHFDGIQIHGPTATGGRLVGPPLLDSLRMGLRSQGTSSAPREVAEAVAVGLGEQWTRFADSVRIPGLAWYPSFAAFPGPMAPPTPNVPMPLAACTMDRAALSARALEQAITRARRSPTGDEPRLFTALATAFALVVDTWLPSQLITNALGTGPVPSFAPPASPVGPVVAGHVIASPGHLAN